MPDDGTAIDLALATEEDLLDELGKRNGGIFVVICRETKGRPDQESTGVRWRGGVMQALGLAHYGVRHMTEYIHGPTVQP